MLDRVRIAASSLLLLTGCVLFFRTTTYDPPDKSAPHAFVHFRTEITHHATPYPHARAYVDGDELRIYQKGKIGHRETRVARVTPGTHEFAQEQLFGDLPVTGKERWGWDPEPTDPCHYRVTMDVVEGASYELVLEYVAAGECKMRCRIIDQDGVDCPTRGFKTKSRIYH